MAIRMYELCGAERDRRFSPFCWRIRLALAHKGLEAEMVPWLYQDIPLIQKLGSSKVPVLIDGDRVVHDSWDIAVYLEETYPDLPSLFPNGQAEARFIKSWSEAVVSLAISPMVVLDIHDHCDPVDQPYFRESREKRFGKPLEQVQADRDSKIDAFRQSLMPLRLTLAQQPFVAGDSPAFVDHMCISPFLWARAISRFPLLQADDPLQGWITRMLDAYGGIARNAPGYPESLGQAAA